MGSHGDTEAQRRLHLCASVSLCEPISRSMRPPRTLRLAGVGGRLQREVALAAVLATARGLVALLVRADVVGRAAAGVAEVLVGGHQTPPCARRGYGWSVLPWCRGPREAP
ncbi:MAG: hypothetical protein AVDCRST_MAG68-4308 [uncultured Gemmatimonadetes bacterium]|uniref:Uncharacterized protein n=1 Tax=uncultured Gemmatimonadota bacterium TaxID=203437 RepID=A0A6J4MGJ8_9BACT|nr:MAG: hypothetical protein AVDCRST_MAG68-4308 [uncultured Gemmatimonadota bacterium]